MAHKDWKQLTTTTFSRKLNIFVWVKETTKSSTRLKVEKGLRFWNVYAFKETRKSRRQVFQKNLIKTKAEAMKIAIAYMRRN